MSLQAFSLSNYKDSVKPPAATLSGFLGLGVLVTMLLPRCTWPEDWGWLVVASGQLANTQAPARS